MSKAINIFLSLKLAFKIRTALNKDKKELNNKIINNNSYIIINLTIKYINKYLNDVNKQILSNYMYCITNKLKGDETDLSSRTFNIRF